MGIFQGSHRGAAQWDSCWHGVSVLPFLENAVFDLRLLHSPHHDHSCGQAPHRGLLDRSCVGARVWTLVHKELLEDPPQLAS